MWSKLYNFLSEPISPLLARTDTAEISKTFRYNTTSVEATALLLNKNNKQQHKQNSNTQKMTNVGQEIRTRPVILPQNAKEHKPQKTGRHEAIGTVSVYSHNNSIY